MPSQLSWLFTSIWLVFCALWAARSLVVRHKKHYAVGKKAVDQNRRYKIVSTLVYLTQILLTIPMFWFKHPYLLKFHNSDGLRMIGFALCFTGLFISISALVSLGSNYSPCYDSHEPFKLITTGFYRWIRHPGWLAKFLVGVGGILVSGSWWFVPLLFWLCVEMTRTIAVEEANLVNVFPEYSSYREGTWHLLPFIY